MVLKEADPLAFPTIIKILKKNGVVIAKCDTVYGILGIAPDTGERIRSIKKREMSKHFLMLISDVSWVRKLTNQKVPPKLSKHWPGPLTIIFSTKNAETVALRVPADPLIARILAKLGKPLYSTSVNLSNEPHIGDIQAIADQFATSVDCIIDSGNCEQGVPSTIVDVSGKQYKIVRQGTLSIPAEDLEQ
jgi:L-threonylcarbamoyladenylate synthase